MSRQTVFKTEKYMDFGTSELWVARIMYGLPKLIDVFPESEYKKQKIRDWIFEISEELATSFSALKQIEKLGNDKSSTIIELKNQYKNFYTSVWRAYKDRLQKACREIGYDIGFLYQKDENFEKESLNFIANNPSIPDKFRKILKIDRRVWQNALSDFRNYYLEHRQVSKEAEKDYYELSMVKIVFNNVWQAIEDILVTLIQSKFKEPITIAEIPEQNRDPNCPIRFVASLTKQGYESLVKTASNEKRK